jgi:hypothetical protein
LEKVRVVVRHKNTNRERAEDIEAEQAPENSAKRFGEIPPGVLSFASGNHDRFDAAVGQSSNDQREEKAQKPSFGSPGHKGFHGTWVLPISKADTIMVWTPAEVEDKGQDQKPDQRDDFQAGKPELCFAIDRDGENVEEDEDDDEDRDPYSDL